MRGRRKTMSDAMTRRDRDDLLKLAKLRERIAKDEAKQRAAELLATAHQQIARTYSPSDDETWKVLDDAAEALVAEADAKVASRCRELGIPERFRPSLDVRWYGRGENAMKDRRAELKAVAQTRCAALEKKAIADIGRNSAAVQERLMIGGLETAAARAEVDAMPTAAQLMPPLDVASLEEAVHQGRLAPAAMAALSSAGLDDRAIEHVLDSLPLEADPDPA